MKVGDKVSINEGVEVSMTKQHLIKSGDIGIIYKIDDSRWPIKVDFGFCVEYFKETDLCEVITPEQIKESSEFIKKLGGQMVEENIDIILEFKPKQMDKNQLENLMKAVECLREVGIKFGIGTNVISELKNFDLYFRNDENSLLNIRRL